MDFNPKCTNKSFNNMKFMKKSEKKIKQMMAKKISINSLENKTIPCKWQIYQLNMQKIKNSKVWEVLEIDKTVQSIF